MIKRLIAVLIGLVFVATMAGCSADGASDPAFKTLRYEGGDTGGSKFKECVDVGEKLASNDTFYSYPTTQREVIWDSKGFVDNNGDGISEGTADFPDLVVTDKDGREVLTKMKIAFFLNTSCEPIEVNGKRYEGGAVQAFHELIGKTRGADFDISQTGTNAYGSGWVWVFTNYLGIPAEDFVRKAVRPLQVENLYNDTTQQENIQEALNESLPALINGVMETDLQFIERTRVTIYAMNPDSEYLGLIKEREDAQIKAETADLNADAKVKEAKANERVALAEAEIRKAEIAGYGGFNNYRCIYLADKGLNCAQPQYITGVR